MISCGHTFFQMVFLTDWNKLNSNQTTNIDIALCTSVYNFLDIQDRVSYTSPHKNATKLER